MNTYGYVEGNPENAIDSSVGKIRNQIPDFSDIGCCQYLLMAFIFLKGLNGMKSIAVIVMLLGLQSVLADKLYRWIDEDGQVHFSDRRPVGHSDEMDMSINSSGSNTSGNYSGLRPGETRWLKKYEKREAERRNRRKAAYRAFTASNERCLRSRGRYQKALHDSIAGDEDERERVKEFYLTMKADCR